jgi:hypothetical protein
MRAAAEDSLPWSSFPEGQVVRPRNELFVVRTGVVVNRFKKMKRFEDAFVHLSSIIGESNSVLGYTLLMKKEFPRTLLQDTYVSLLADVHTHMNPKFVYKDQKVHLMRFNSTQDPSYWFLVRHRAG